MKNTSKLGNVLRISLAIAVLGIASCEKKNIVKNGPNGEPVAMDSKGNGGGGSQTAQSIMIDVQGITNVIISNNEVWKFDQEQAAIDYFGLNSCTTNQCRNQARSAAQAARCSLWTADRQGWYLHQSSSSGGATFTLSATLAGESFMKGGQFNNLGKYSFSLKDNNDESRITNLAYSIDGGEPIALGHSIVDGNSTANNCLLDMNYLGNAGVFGNSNVYNRLHAPGYAGTATIGEILASDDPTNNDAGCPGVSIAVTDPMIFALGVGSHTITITGTVKGNNGETNVNVSSTSYITITADSCE